MKSSHLIQYWDLATEHIFPFTGPLSARKTFSDDILDVVSLTTGDAVDLTSRQADTLLRLQGALDDDGYCTDADALLLAEAVVVGARTANCAQQDFELHRRNDVIGSYSQTGNGYLTHVAETTYHGIEISDLFRREDPIDVILHPADGQESQKLEYVCSVLVDPHSVQISEDEDEPGSITHICDIHHGAGWQSLTVIRITDTDDGITKTIIHTDVTPLP